MTHGRGAWTKVGMPVNSPNGTRKGGPVPVDPYERLMRRVVERDGCWVFTGSTNGYGYGQISIRRGEAWQRILTGHRLSYERNIGPIPDGYDVHHSCGTRACVNPAHLELITHAAHASHHHLGQSRNRALSEVCRLCGSDDWRISPTGRRRCRACAHAYEMSRNAR